MKVIPKLHHIIKSCDAVEESMTYCFRILNRIQKNHPTLILPTNFELDLLPALWYILRSGKFSLRGLAVSEADQVLE